MKHMESKQSNTTNNNSSTVSQTIVNVMKLCMGIGTLTLPFSASQGGMVFNVFGLFIVTNWNQHSIHCLLHCLELIPTDTTNDETSHLLLVNHNHNNNHNHCSSTTKHLTYSSTQQQQHSNNSSEDTVASSSTTTAVPNCSTFGKMAWYAFGPIGLHVIDGLMLCLMFGIIIACEDAILGFVQETPFTTQSKAKDTILILVVCILPLASLSEFKYMANFSACGIVAILCVYGSILWYGHDLLQQQPQQYTTTVPTTIPLWPASTTAFSNWFGVAVFGYGIVPFTYTLQEAMKDPKQMKYATKYALYFVGVTYCIIGDVTTFVFLRTTMPHGFAGDVLTALPTGSGTGIRLLMALVVATTIPLISVPTGDLLLEKLHLGTTTTTTTTSRVRQLVRWSVCSVCAVVSATVPNFCYVISFLGCFCVALLSFVYPPLVHGVLYYQKYTTTAAPRILLQDLGLVTVGTITTVWTSYLTYQNLLQQL